jgi:phage terminase small subunit
MKAKHERFAQEFLVDLNATAAAARAGYSKTTSHVQGFRLLQRPDVQARIAELKKQRSDRTEVTMDRVVLELARIAFADLGAAFDETGKLRPIHEMPEEVRRALSGFDLEEMFDGRGSEREHVGNVRKVRTQEKVRALELLGKHLGMFIERHEVKVGNLSPQQRAARVAALLKKGGGDV